MSSSFAAPRPALGFPSGLRAAAIVVVLVVALTLVYGVASAQAAKGIVGVVGAFVDQPGSGEGEFIDAAGVAVNQSNGDVYVVDVGNDRVQRFAADGSFISQFGGSGSGEGEFSFSGFEMAGIAVDSSDGSVYVADTSNNRIQKFDADGTFVSQFGNTGSDPDNPAEDGELFGPISVAVDPVSGDVLVADRDNNRIQRFDSSGSYLSQFNGSAQNPGDPETSISSPYRVAVDSTGAIYVLEYFNQVQKFSPAGVFIEAFGSGHISSPEEIATAGDRVYVTQIGGPGAVVLEFDPALAVDQLIETHNIETFSPSTYGMFGLAAHAASGRVYLNTMIESSAAVPVRRVFILDDGGIPPAIVTLFPASEVETTSATLHAEIDSNGGLPTDYRLQISPDGINWTPVDSGSVPGRSTNTPITANIDGLRPNTLYRFRIVTNKGFGSADVISLEQDFLTDPAPPDILDSRAGTVDTTSVVLLGSINPNSSQTQYRFDFGIGAFNRSIPIPEASIGSGADPVFVSQTIQGLAPNTTYQFRVVATNSTDTTTGPTKTFTTASVPPEGRGYELVSPADKPGGVGVGIWYAGPATSATVGTGAYDGERFAVQGSFGSIVIEAPVAYGGDWAFAERTPQGWISKPGLSRRAHGSQLFTIAELQESTEDLSLTAFSSNSHLLRFFPELETWNEAITGPALLVRDWTSDWELVAPTEFSQARLGDNLQPPGKAAKAFASDGSAIVASAPSLRGLAGTGDPTDSPERRVDAAAVYLDEIVRPFTGTFPGDDGVRERVDVCTGEGPARTVIPPGVPCPPASGGRDPHPISPVGGGALNVPGSLAPNVSPRVISSDGSRVFFMSPDPALNGAAGQPQVYVRQRNSDSSCGEPPCVVTRWISRPVAGTPSESLRAAYFESASRDGDKVLFRTTTPLTADDPNGGLSNDAASDQSSDLYMYDLPAGNDPAGGQLTRISGGPTGDSDCNSPQEARPHGAVRYASDDAARIYFVCTGPLNGTTASAGGSITTPGGSPTSSDALNLYLYDASRPAAQRWRFIARLPRGGSPQGCATTATGNNAALVKDTLAEKADFSQEGNCFNGTGDGSLVTFFTDGRLTADDPDGVTGDIYGYDATGDELVRISAPQGGAGGTYDCGPENPIDSTQCYGDGGISEPIDRQLRRLGVAVRPDGTRLAFFQSRSRLVPGDVDDAYDVYGWREGELSLISTGQSDTDGAFYVGNDRSGLNVYIATRDRLTWQDQDAVLDVYTARVGGGIPEPDRPGLCAVLADECQATGGGASFGTPDTGVEAGDGDAVSAPRGKVSLKALTAKQRALLAAGRTVPLRVVVNLPGRVSVKGRARIGRRMSTVLSKSKVAPKAGTVRVMVRLSRAARRRLASSPRLRLALRVKFTRAPEAVSRTVTLTRPSTGPKRRATVRATGIGR